MPDGVEVTQNGRILEVKLNKPKVNAIDIPMSQALGAAFAESYVIIQICGSEF